LEPIFKRRGSGDFNFKQTKENDPAERFGAFRRAMMLKKPSFFSLESWGGGVSGCGEVLADQRFLSVMNAIETLDNGNQATFLNFFLNIPFYVASAYHDLH
jgi:hypothetical protein